MAYTRIKQLVGTTAEWSTNNPILLVNEIGYEKTITGEWRMKIGDGLTPWNSLSYMVFI
jgi:hypothetical protein